MTNANKNKCRFCGDKVFELIDLGCLPLANALVSSPSDPVDTYPTVLYICSSCSTAQLSHCVDQEVLYSDYVYITPESSILTRHYSKIVGFLTRKSYLNEATNVLEIGSNIGHFLQHIKPYTNSVMGVDPAKNIASMAIEAGIPTVSQFFNRETAKQIATDHHKMDLIVARHCFAHNEKPWEMLEGVAELLTSNGVFLIENAYFSDTVEKREFDQIYHEHMYYYNLRAIQQVSKKYGFKLIDCLHSRVHGGTMLYIVKREDAKRELSENVLQYLELEKDAHKTHYYGSFIASIEENKHKIKALLQQLRLEGKTIHAYGASAKSVTLLNYFDIDSSMIPYVVDSTVTKHGKYLPLTQIKIISEEEAQGDPPDYYLLTIWNYKEEIIRKIRQTGNRHTKLIIPHPRVSVIG